MTYGFQSHQLQSETPILLRIFPDTLDRHITTVLTGAFELEKGGGVEVHLTDRMKKPVAGSGAHSLWAEVDGPNGPSSLCFDMTDWPWISSLSRLHACDYYFKRSFDREILEQLIPDNVHKVYPFGLYFPCASASAPSVAPMLWKRAKTHSFYTHDIRRLFRDLLNPLAHHANATVRKGFSPQQYPFLQELEVRPDQFAKQRIVFKTRVWDPTLHSSSFGPSICEINEQRISLARALGKAFRGRHEGGIIADDYSQRICADLVAKDDISPYEYIRAMHSCAIAVTTVGLHGSIGAKLPEYMAASRCIVSDGLRFDPGVRPEPGRHYFEFNKIDECIAHCEALLSSPARVTQARKESYQFYIDHVHPARSVERCLRTVWGGERVSATSRT